MGDGDIERKYGNCPHCGEDVTIEIERRTIHTRGSKFLRTEVKLKKPD